MPNTATWMHSNNWRTGDPTGTFRNKDTGEEYRYVIEWDGQRKLLIYYPTDAAGNIIFDHSINMNMILVARGNFEFVPHTWHVPQTPPIMPSPSDTDFAFNDGPKPETADEPIKINFREFL